MHNPIKQIVRQARTFVELGYRVMRGFDYQILSQYIVKINKHRDIGDVMNEVSHCLKDVLDYELFGFALKNGSKLDLWVDPRAFSDQLTGYIMREFQGQKIDYIVHNFTQDAGDHRHISDNQEAGLISYRIIEGEHSATMYILPRKKMLLHHEAIVNTIINSIGVALEKNLSIERLENAAAIDPLTGCYNRRALDTFIDNDIAYARRHRTDLSVILIDLDNFKALNDEYGHQAGDAILKAIAQLLPAQVRKSDYVARYGGEEFVLVLPDSSLYNAVQLAHKLRKAVERLVVPFSGVSLSVTASFGVASLERKRDHAALFYEADERLYQAKAGGKNSVVPSLLPCFADRSFVAKKNTTTLRRANAATTA
jgi:diguanylate cyclase (GGDEF)-like protein